MRGGSAGAGSAVTPVPGAHNSPDPVVVNAALGVELGAEMVVLALTHRSYAYENGGLPTNERLEFLGDSVLGVIITDALYRTHPTLPEGRLAKLRASVVNMHALAGVGRGIGLGEQLRLGRGEELTGGREKASIVADAVEAVIGAVYLEHGLETASAVGLERGVRGGADGSVEITDGSAAGADGSAGSGGAVDGPTPPSGA